MPGPVSDSYDPEWGTAANADSIKEALDPLYQRLSDILGHQTPMYILNLVRTDLPDLIKAELSEKEWRLLRFCVERAIASL